jgi:hypothetical protein
MQTQQGSFSRADVLPTLKRAWSLMWKTEIVISSMKKVMSRDFVVGQASADRRALTPPEPAASSSSNSSDIIDLTPAGIDAAFKAAEAAKDPNPESRLALAPNLDAFIDQLVKEDLSKLELEPLLRQAIKQAALQIPGAADTFVQVRRASVRCNWRARVHTRNSTQPQQPRTRAEPRDKDQAGPHHIGACRAPPDQHQLHAGVERTRNECRDESTGQD